MFTPIHRCSENPPIDVQKQRQYINYFDAAKLSIHRQFEHLRHFPPNKVFAAKKRKYKMAASIWLPNIEEFFVSLTNLIVDTASRDSADFFARLVWLMTILCCNSLIIYFYVLTRVILKLSNFLRSFIT